MNLTSVKTLSELHLNGIRIDWVREDKTIKELRLHDGNGGRIVIRTGQYGDALKVMVPQPYDEEDRWHLSGDLAGLTNVSEYFDSEYEASDKKREYEGKVRGDTDLTVKKVKVQIDDKGNVVEAKDKPNDGEEIAF